MFEPPTRGVIGLVEDLLKSCPEQGLRLHWHVDRCRLSSPVNGSAAVLEPPLSKSVFRAILARVATLCNEQGSGSVTPYGGRGELLLGSDPPLAFRVTFTNTPDEQKLELVPLPAAPASRGGLQNTSGPRG